MLNFVLQLVWIGFMYYIVSENNKKSEYQGNPILYAILTFFVGFIGGLGYYFGNKFKHEDKTVLSLVGFGVGILFTMMNVLVLFI